MINQGGTPFPRPYSKHLEMFFATSSLEISALDCFDT